MTTLTLNSIQQTGVQADQGSAARPNPPSVGQKAISSDTTPDDDTVLLSAAAQTPEQPVHATKSLSESEADAAAVSLRSQLGTQGLSVTARQNQAIVALLRR